MNQAFIQDLTHEAAQQEAAMIAALGEAATYRLILALAMTELEEALRLKERAHERLRQIMGTKPWHEEQDDSMETRAE